MKINDNTKRELLKLARKTIEEKLFGSSDIETDLSDTVFDEVSGVFVTLHMQGNLKGCIGNIIGIVPLREGIQNMAIASAFEDPRFRALTKEEYPDIDIEITILSPLEPASPEDVEIGKHGVVITKGIHKGLLLPQVATEHGMDRETFLSHTCLKAGLYPGCWKDEGTKIEVFTGVVFSEKELLDK